MPFIGAQDEKKGRRGGRAVYALWILDVATESFDISLGAEGLHRGSGHRRFTLPHMLLSEQKLTVEV
jgi:hypothetical protein